jgi:DNA repair protein RadA/Sms
MSKVKQLFFVKTVAHNMPNGKDNATCKEWNTIAEEIIQKQEKVAWKSETLQQVAPKPYE